MEGTEVGLRKDKREKTEGGGQEETFRGAPCLCLCFWSCCSECQSESRLSCSFLSRSHSFCGFPEPAEAHFSSGSNGWWPPSHANRAALNDDCVAGSNTDTQERACTPRRASECFLCSPDAKNTSFKHSDMRLSPQSLQFCWFTTLNANGNKYTSPEHLLKENKWVLCFRGVQIIDIWRNLKQFYQRSSVFISSSSFLQQTARFVLNCSINIL